MIKVVAVAVVLAPVRLCSRGARGVVLAAPLTVLRFVLVKRVYVSETLDMPTEMPGESKD